MRKSVVLVLDPIQQLIEYAQLAEQAGFDAAWLMDFNNRDAFLCRCARRSPTRMNRR